MLVFDLPENVVNVLLKHVESWNKNIDELFEIGKRNIRKNYAVTFSEEKVGEHTIWFAEADHLFASNIVFDIANHSQVIGSNGSLVAIPNRHTVMIYPIQDLEVLKVLGNILHLTSNMYERGPGSIADTLYWYKDGEFINMPRDREDGKLTLAVPQEFIDSLNKMSESQDK